MKKIFLILFISVTLFAQDSHYWNIFPGNNAMLYGASAIAGVNDFSTGYYNPGNVGFVDKNFSISGNLFYFEGSKLFNGAGEANDINSGVFEWLTNMTAGPIPFQLDKKGVLGYIVFQKQAAIQNYTLIKHEYKDLISEVSSGTRPPIFSGKEFYTSDFNFKVNLYEYWAGLTWGRATKHWGIGFSAFVPWRTQTNFFQLYSSASDLQNNVAVTTDFNYTIDYFDARILLKTGLVYKGDDFNFGFTFTSPSVHLYGQAEVRGKITSTGFYLTDTNNVVSGPYDFIATNRENRLPTDYASPLSFAAGFVKKIGTLEAGFGFEYFDGIRRKVFVSPSDKNFVIINPQPDSISVNGKLVLLTTYQKSKPVLNFGFSLKNNFNEKLSLGFTFRTDFSTTDKKDDKYVYINNSAWNIYHITFGGVYKVGKTTLGLNLEYSFSRDKNMVSYTNLNSQPLENNQMFLINRSNAKTNISYNRLMLSVGITYFFGTIN